MEHSRRRFVAWLPLVGAASIASRAHAASDPNLEYLDDPFILPRLKESHPRAIAAGYVRDASTLAAYKPGVVCRNCALFEAARDAEWGPCHALPGAVAGRGWCNLYLPRET